MSAEDVDRAAVSGAYVSGLHLEGAGWSSEDMSLMEQPPGQLQCAMPVVLFEPKMVEHINLTQSMYEAPTYKTSERHGVLSTTVRTLRLVRWLCTRR